MELLEALRVPFGTGGAGNCLGTRECNVENVVVCVAVVPVHGIAKASRGQGYSSLANHRLRVAVLVAPYAVELRWSETPVAYWGRTAHAFRGLYFLAHSPCYFRKQWP